MQNEEGRSQSAHSPGVVADDEFLLRLGYAPEHFLNGEVVVSAISSADLSKRGFSVDREKFALEKLIRERSLQQMEHSPGKREQTFLSRFRTGDLRKELTEDGSRAFVILDTAELDNPAHASIRSARIRSPSEIKELKLLLIPYLQNPLPLQDYFAKSYSLTQALKTPMPLRRADVALAERGLFESRAKAREAILAGLVSVDGRVIAKPSERIASDADIVARAPYPWASRGGVKLAHALDLFGVDPTGRYLSRHRRLDRRLHRRSAGARREACRRRRCRPWPIA